MRLTTATGTTWKNFDRSEISFIGQRMGKKDIINISAIAIDKIGREKSDLTDNVTRVSRLYIFTVELHDHLIKQADASEEEIQMIVGQRSAQLLLEEIRPAQLKVKQPWILLPNVKIYETESMIGVLVNGPQLPGDLPSVAQLSGPC